MAACWTSELIPGFLKQFIKTEEILNGKLHFLCSASFVTASQESQSIFITCKFEIFG